MKHKCRNRWCPNHYDDVAGLYSKVRGAQCVPCLYATQMREQGTSPSQVESVPQLKAQFDALLGAAGWTWQHVVDSYEARA